MPDIYSLNVHAEKYGTGYRHASVIMILLWPSIILSIIGNRNILES